MNPFLQGQMDYIFFFYGLAFIGLGVVCSILSKEANPRLPWGWLALFGLTHGANEWLDLVGLSWPGVMWFGALRWAVMTASFLCLVEFARLTLTQKRGRGPGRWLLVVLCLGAGLGGLSSWSSLNATTRYFLGLVGSLGAGWALFAEAREAEPRCRPWLLAGGVGFIFYGLATGLVVPQAGFWPAAVVNHETFASLTGLPIQLVRGLLALWIACMITGYFQVAWPAEYKRCHRYRSRYLYGAGAALLLILAGGWFLTQSLGNLAWQQVRQTSLAHNQLAVQRLAFDLAQAEESVKAMSGSPWIAPALESISPQTLAQAHAVLDRYQQRFGASVAYLMDDSGVTIASSNRDDPDSFVGKNYAFRPYFLEAMAGKVGRYFALGVTSKKRGFYASFPVKDQTGKIIGVAVLKMTLNRFQQELQGFDPAFLIDPQGIVFVASRPSLDYHSLWPLSVGDPAAFKSQYGTDRFTPIFSQPLVNEAKVELAGKCYVVSRQNLVEVIAPGWTLVNLESFAPVMYYRLMGIAAAFILVFLTLVFAGANLSTREGANRIMASEARFRAMFTAAPEAVFVFDPETRRILEANSFMAQWLGYGPDELVGLEIDQVRAPESLESQESQEEFAGEGPPRSPGARYRKKDGSLVDVECTAANIFHGDHLREIVFVRDITARKRAEAELKEERDFISTLLNTIGALVVVLDPQGHIVRFNRACEQVSGYSLEEVKGKLVWDRLIPPEEVETIQKVFRSLLTDFAPGEQENYWVARDGQRRLIAWSNTSLKDAEGRVTHVIGTGIDVTARRQAETEVREAKEYLENILENSADPIGIVDQRGKIIQWNKAAAQVFGYSRYELEGKSSFELYADKSELHELLTQLRRDGSVHGYEINMKRKDGEIARFALSINLLYDRSRKPIGSVCVARNLSEIQKTLNDLAAVNQRLEHEVTERKQMETALYETNSGLQTILDNVQTGVLIIDPDTHLIVEANPVAGKMIGLAKENIIGQACHKFMCSAEDGKCPITDLQETLKNSERILLQAGGEKIWILKTVVPVFLHGKTHLLESFVDITERRQWEEAIQTTNDKLHALVAQVEERNRTMSQANEMADMLQACQTSDEAYQAIGHFMPRLFPDDAGALYMLNNSRNLFETVASWGQAPDLVSIFAPDECWSVRRGRLHKVENAQETLRCRHMAESVPGYYLCVPLIAQGETLGVFHLRLGAPAPGQSPELATVSDQLAMTVAEDLALALANLRLRETLRSQAIRDPLTGLFNRRYLEETMEREINRVRRQETSLGVIMMDLDHFKEYNDTFGHSAGDELLSALGILLKSQIRGEDIACRYGGEEFLLILPGASREIALERAETLRQAVKEMHQHHQGLKPTTLSLGVAVYPDHGDTGLQLIRSADAALYRAKNAGRDRMVAAYSAGETTPVNLPAPPPAHLKAS
jgi:diguanylate cyclase (GGDEF)-like protein/PAS domain S-box-containing protein